MRKAMKKNIIDFSVWSPRLLAVLRMVTGLLFIEHATMKLFLFPGPIPGPYPLPPIEIAAGIIEAVVGPLVMLGLFARVAAFIASGEMAVAYFLVHLKISVWPTLNFGEPVIFFCFIFLYMSAAGAGSWSLDQVRETWRSRAELPRGRDASSPV
jgi:putative oxidoreductase